MKVKIRNFKFREIVRIISEKEELRKYKDCLGVIKGIAKEDDDDFVYNYSVAMLDKEGATQEYEDFYPEDLQTTGKFAHSELDNSGVILRVSQEGKILGVKQPEGDYFICMIGLKQFVYEEDDKEIKISLENEVYAKNKSHEIVQKSHFKEWDDGKSISTKKQKQIMENFKEGMLTRFGVEIDYQ